MSEVASQLTSNHISECGAGFHFHSSAAELKGCIQGPAGGRDHRCRVGATAGCCGELSPRDQCCHSDMSVWRCVMR